MNANENNNTVNQEVYDGVKEVMLQEGVIPKEIIKRNEVIREKKEMQEKFQFFKDGLSMGTNAIESIGKQYPILQPIITPIKIIVKKAGLPFEIIDLILEYQINGEEGVIIKIGGKIIETIIFGAGTSIALAIAATVAGYFASMSIVATIVGFVVFAGIAGLTIWISNQSEILLRFIYENVYVRLKKEKERFLNFTDYIFSGQWYEDLKDEIAKELKNKIKKEMYKIIENPIGRFIFK